MQKITISIVVPVYSGSRFLRELVKEIELVKMDFEESISSISISQVIFVDDASIDDSSKILYDLSHTHNWVSILKLGRNFGQHAATIAGILHSDGDWVITMDEDLQHPPSKIRSLFEKAAKTSCDVVYAVPSNSVHENWFRDFSSRTCLLYTSDAADE